MKRNEPISHLMTTDVRTAHLGQPLSEVRKLMGDGGFHHVPVVSGKHLAGLVTSTDLLKVTYQFKADDREIDAVLDATVKIEDLMQKYPVTLRSTNTIRDAVQILAEGRFHALPVVNDTDELVGLVTTTDLLRYLLEQY
ncbi:MAG: CBS domain-containing protein [Myxococcota bacterium]